MIDVFFIVKFRQCSGASVLTEVRFDTLNHVRDFLLMFVYCDYSIALHDVTVTRVYMDFEHENEVLSLESIFFGTRS